MSATNGPATTPPVVIVVGAGFGGLNAAKALARLPVRTIVIDRNNHHLFTPLLYQVASALLEPGDIAQPVRRILRGAGNCEFRLGEVTGVDLDAHVVHVGDAALHYDHLVIACGSRTSYFGHETFAEHTFDLKDLGGAVALRNHVLERFEDARWESDPERRRVLMRFVVVGGGPTGVEYAGALRELIAGPLRHDFRDLDMGMAEVHLVEGGEHLLSPFAPRLRRSARRLLERKGVLVELDRPVADVDAAGVSFKDGSRLESATVIWTAGVEAEALGGDLAGVEQDRQHRVRVRETLQLPGHDDVWVIGDMAACRDAHHGELPMLAPVAIQEARHAVANIERALRGAPPEPMRYRDKGIMATIGRNAGIMQLGPIHISGFIGWVGWLTVHLVLILGFRHKLVVLFEWAWNYVFRDRPVRLILPGPSRR